MTHATLTPDHLDKKKVAFPRAKTELHQLIDTLIRFSLALTFAFGAGTCFRSFLNEMNGVDFAHIDSKKFGDTLGLLAIGLYSLMVACLYVVRFNPIKRSTGAMPCAAAILGGFLMSGIMFLHRRDDLPLSADITACALVVIGNAFAIMIMMRLGRSFSILPESRKLVTSGPYHVIRHPLYLAEAVSTLGAVIHFLSIWAIAMVAVQLLLQVVRMRYEEKVLRETFPEYADYARRTARLIPGVY